MEELLKTPLYTEHLKLGARMIPFDGFDMPVQYSSIIEEHLAVRENVGLFDVSHMGEIELLGRDALAFTDYLLTNSISNMKDGEIKYSPLCYPHGGQVDDLFVYKIKDDFILLVVNASPNYSIKDYDWIIQHKKDYQVEIFNKSKEYAEVAVQGPKSVELLEPLVKASIPLRNLKRFNFIYADLFGKKILISRTGYTGEDGFEIYTFQPEDILDIWSGLLEESQKFNLKPCGLGARDTTRFEVCYWLYGNDIDETVNPLESGQGWTVKFNKENFIGKEALLKIQKEGIKRKLVGLFVPHGGIPRHGMEVWYEKQKIGYITSGNYCPSLKKVYALAILEIPFTRTGNKVKVLIRDKGVEAEIVDIPFLAPFNKR
ncbi:MAG: glycine cleavage system aminomethyltransferase GcvT [Candidatus Caldatribacteriota bacterium]